MITDLQDVLQVSRRTARRYASDGIPDGPAAQLWVAYRAGRLVPETCVVRISPRGEFVIDGQTWAEQELLAWPFVRQRLAELEKLNRAPAQYYLPFECGGQVRDGFKL